MEIEWQIQREGILTAFCMALATAMRSLCMEGIKLHFSSSRNSLGD